MHSPDRTRPRRWLVAIVAVLALGLTACQTGSNDASAELDTLREEIDQRFNNIEDRLTAVEQAQSEVASDLGAASEDEPEVGAADPADTELGDEDLLEDPDAYTGELVTTTAVVEQVLTDNAFTIGGPGESLLVVAASADADMGIVEQGARVRVTGTVSESFDAASVADEFGVELDAEALETYEGQTYLAADVIGEPVNAPESES